MSRILVSPFSTLSLAFIPSWARIRLSLYSSPSWLIAFFSIDAFQASCASGGLVAQSLLFFT
uniref:Uncharacterized protein n=1 Tax=uncultured marine virus TaxID=186617 RepID=A0A0F7L9Q7_9VIRU|nr:hypothetical protein [uncultured marine virus]